jgi:hypothetical protein
VASLQPRWFTGEEHIDDILISVSYKNAALSHKLSAVFLPDLLLLQLLSGSSYNKSNF